MRVAVQLGAGSLAVHQLRYLAGHGHDSHRSLGDHGHAYLTVVTPLVALLVALALAHFVWAVWARRADALAGRGRMTVWTLASALLTIHVGQEAVESWLGFGHPLSVSTVLADGGWLALPLCLLVGALLTWLTGGARRLARKVLDRRGEAARAASHTLAPLPPAVAAKTSAPLARHGAERAPPLLVG